MNPTAKLKILAKIHAIQKDVKAMAKEGTNEFQKYKYLMEAQVAEQFKELLEKHGVAFITSSKITGVIAPLESGAKQFLTSVAVDYRFIDVESGEEIYGTAAGQGTDSGDKGVYKAITGAIKYIFMKNFLIPTGFDPEEDDGGNIRRSIKAKPPTIDLSKPPFGEGSDVD